MSSLLKSLFAVPLRALTWIGDQGTRAVAAVVFIAVAVPPIGALLRPYLTWAIVGLLCISFMGTSPTKVACASSANSHRERIIRRH